MLGTPALAAALAGLGLGLSLFVAIGAQNVFVLRQGLRGEHLLPVVAVCALSDALLITAGVAGAGVLLERLPWLLPVFRFGGAAFLLGYAAVAARRAAGPAVLRTETTGPGASLEATLSTVLALTWLNPHVYLDTVVLLGSIAQTHGDQRGWFAAGAVTGSAVWFTALGCGARLLRPLFARPASWRVLDAGIALVMVAIAVSLLADARQQTFMVYQVTSRIL